MSDYEEFVKRMGSFDMELSLDDVGPNKNELIHYGILGMKWGVRRYQNKDGTLTSAGKKRYENKVGERSKEGPKDIDKRKVLLSAKTKTGAEITLSEDPPSPIAKLLKKIIPSDDTQYDLTIRDSSGKKVGDMSMINVSDEEINFAWIGIKNSQRGKGYAQASIKAAIDFAKKEGKKIITMEDVATPDGKYIYDKLGFKEVPMNSPLSKFSKMSASELEDYKMSWGEPRPMVMYLDDNIKHSSSPLDMSSFFNLVMRYMDFVDEEGRFMESLTHYGILGMKWGVRRYQNKDGSLTPAGKKRYERDIQTNLSKKKDSRIDTSKPDPNRWVKEDITRKKKITDASSKLVTELQNIEKKTRLKTTKMDLSKMTDKEMRDRINRELLERQYTNLFISENASNISKGREFVKNTLDVAGTTLALTGSALGIALAIKELKG